MALKHVWVTFLVVGAGCGGGSSKQTGGPTGSGMSTTVMVPADMGGMITLEGTTLEVPPGALPADTAITITSSTTTPPTTYASWNSPVYEFGPDGLVFLMPVNITLTFAGSPSAPGVQWSTPEGGFENRGGTVSGTKITATVLHFSKGFVADAPGPLDPDAGNPPPPPPGSDGGGGHDSGPGPDSGPTGDGGPTSPDGGTTPDGGVIHPDGGPTSPDGGPTSPDGGTTSPDGGVPHPDGSVTSPDGGPTSPPDGGSTSPDGGVPHPDGGSTSPDGGPTTPPDGGPTSPPDGGLAPDASGPTPK